MMRASEILGLYEAILKNYFHGTGSTFDKFTKPGTGKHGVGFYFTPSENEANHFAKTLYGAGEGEKKPRVIKVELNVKKAFNTMSIEDAQKVASHYGLEYKIPKRAGGPNEHCHFLQAQLIGAKIASKSNFNEKIKAAGFDAIKYDLMEHIIVFDAKQIKIVGSYFLETYGLFQRAVVAEVLGLGWPHSFLAERSYGAYLEKHGLIFLYGAKNRQGAVAIIFKAPPHYSIAFLKDNKMINSSSASVVVGQGVEEGINLFNVVVKYAESKGVVKSVVRNLAGPDFAKLMLVKEGLHVSAFESLFPELKTVHAADGMKVAGFNVTGFDGLKDPKAATQAITQAAAKVSQHGFKHLVYGNIMLIGSAMKSSTLADYESSSDQIRLKVGSRTDGREGGLTQSLIHEMGHRQEAKFKVDTSLLNMAFQEARTKEPILKVGTVVISPKTKRMIEIERVTLKRGKIAYEGHYSDAPETKITAQEGIALWPVVKGEKPEIHPLRVSNYAMSHPKEFWAEIFAHAIMTNDHYLLGWVNKITK